MASWWWPWARRADPSRANADESLGAIPGFELLYRSPPEIVGVAGVASDYFRLYRIAPAR